MRGRCGAPARRSPRSAPRPRRRDYRRRQRRGASAEPGEGINVLAPPAPAPAWIGSETRISAASDHRGGIETLGRGKRRQADGQPPAAAPVPPGTRGMCPRGYGPPRPHARGVAAAPGSAAAPDPAEKRRVLRGAAAGRPRPAPRSGRPQAPPRPSPPRNDRDGWRRRQLRGDGRGPGAASPLRRHLLDVSPMTLSTSPEISLAAAPPTASPRRTRGRPTPPRSALPGGPARLARPRPGQAPPFAGRSGRACPARGGGRGRAGRGGAGSGARPPVRPPALLQSGLCLRLRRRSRVPGPAGGRRERERSGGRAAGDSESHRGCGSTSSPRTVQCPAARGEQRLRFPAVAQRVPPAAEFS